MPGRKYTAPDSDYRFGFNGMEKESDITGVDGGHMVFEYRIQDTRLGRFLSVDPLSSNYPWNSTYAFAENRVIDGIDLEGLEYISVHEVANYYGIRVETVIKTFKDVIIDHNGEQYINVGMHIFNGNGKKLTEWIYTDINVYDDAIHKAYTFHDPTYTDTYIDSNGDEQPCSGNCARLANKQANELGTNLKGDMVSYNNIIEVFNAKTGTLVDVDGSAVDYINSQLESGNAVVVGVNYDDANSNYGTDSRGTDHYVTIVGRTVNSNGENAFVFIENAVGGSEATDFDNNQIIPGKSSNNSGGTNSNLGGTSNFMPDYDVTRVQVNK